MCNGSTPVAALLPPAASAAECSADPSILLCHAFAAVLGDGSVVTCGVLEIAVGSAVPDRLKNAQQIQASSNAFAAM